jgi:drug/metabolite transporter (DMT)-like permease
MSFLLAVLSAMSSGVTTVLQATAARRTPHAARLQASMVVRLASQGAFLVSMVVSVVGFVLAALALRRLPLFAAQAVFASSVGFAAVIAAAVHGERIDRTVQACLACIVGGLVLIGFASDDQAVPTTTLRWRYGLIVALAVALVMTSLVARRRGRTGFDVGLLGACSGVFYGIVALGVRTTPTFQVRSLLTEPAAWAVLIGAVAGIISFAMALQRGSIAVAGGASALAESLLPTFVGVVLLGERATPGWEAIAAIGVLLSLGGAIALCRDMDHLMHDDPTPDAIAAAG